MHHRGLDGVHDGLLLPPAAPLLLLVFAGLVSVVVDSSAGVSCNLAQLECTYRIGCGMALQSYVRGCSDVIAGRTAYCPEPCGRALIALTSTEEGRALSECDCGGEEFCLLTKRRVEVCRPQVSRATHTSSVVGCSVAQLICAADSLCSTALEYYHRLCRPMIQGRKCTARCNNSLAILNRQEKAAKLRTCFCDGTEDFACDVIKRNTDRLCFGRETTMPSSTSTSASASITTTTTTTIVAAVILFAVHLLVS